MRFAIREHLRRKKLGRYRTATSLLIAGVCLLLPPTVSAQQPGPFTAQDFQFSSPSSQSQIPPQLYGPDLDGNTPSEIALSAGAVRARLRGLGFHSISSMQFRHGYWQVVAYHGEQKRQLTVHPESGRIRSDKPYCNSHCINDQ